MGDGGQGAGRDGHPRRPAVHPHQRAWPTCTCRCGRAPTSRSSAALINHVLENELDFREYVVAYTNAAAIVDEDFRDTEDLDGLFSGFDPETRAATTRRPGSTRAHRGHRRPASATRTSPTAGRRRRRRRRPGEEHGPAAPRPAAPEGRRCRPSPERDETLQHPRCVYQILKRHFARYTPEMVERGLRHRRRSSSCRSPRRSTANSGRERTTRVRATRWAGPSTRVGVAVHPRPRRSCSCCWATSAGPAAASWRCAATPASRAPPTSRRCSTSCPGYIPMPHARQHDDLDDFVAERRRQHRASGATCDAYMVSLLKAWWGDAATAENDFCFDYLPRLTGDHGTYDTVMRHDRGHRARATSCSARTRPSARPTGRCSASAWPTSSGWSCATCR